MNKLPILFLIYFLAGCKSAGNNSDCIDQSKINPDLMCYELYKPVCGCDGKTYSNDCVAKKNGVTTWEEGECKESDTSKN